VESPALGEAGLPRSNLRMSVETWCVLGVRVDAVTLRQTLARIGTWVEEGRQQRAPGSTLRTRQVVTLNPEMVMAARADVTLRDLFNSADLVVPDGSGIVWAVRRRGGRMYHRVTGVDCVTALAERAAQRGWRVFLLGAAPGVADEAARRLQGRFPGLRIAGTYPGTPDPSQDERMTGLVRASAADVVCVAYGAPHQERWIARNRDRLGAAVALGVGGTLDFLAGRVPRAPAWMRHIGIEWAYRLWREPWRWRRMLALPRFVLAVYGAREAVQQMGRTEV
jgi:N-acetylglucosaminyldiphosphoundecaprenol N-acetyl-beta-D-mannosaminyltransferase